MRSFPKLATTAVVTTMLTFAMAPSKAAAEDKVYTLSELDVVNQVVPDYPRQAARAGFAGWVELQFTVSPDGSLCASSSETFMRGLEMRRNATPQSAFEPFGIGNPCDPLKQRPPP